MNGLFTAGQLAGSFLVVASCGCGKADTTGITVTSGPATLVSVSVSPDSVSLAPNGTQTFAVVGRMSDGSTTPVSVTWSAQGGSMSGNTYTAGSTAGRYPIVARLSTGTLADTSFAVVTAASPPPPPPPPPPSGQDPTPSGTILLDTRAGRPQSIQNATDLQGALAALQSSPLIRQTDHTGGQFTTDFDGRGTHAFRFAWNDYNGVPADQGRRIRIYLGMNPRPKKLYIQWKNWMGRTPTGGGLGAIGAFDVTNPAENNYGRKYLLLARDVADMGNTGRVDHIWPYPAPIKPRVEGWYNMATIPGNLALNRSNWNPQQHYNQQITFTFYFQAESSPGARDGVVRIWYNGVMVAEHLNEPTGTMGIDRFNMSDIMRSPVQDQTEYFWDLVVWSP